jgi:hypothetical protein
MLLITGCFLYAVVALLRGLDWLTTRYIGGIGSDHHKKHGQYRGNVLTLLEFLGYSIGWFPWILFKLIDGLKKGK